MNNYVRSFTTSKVFDRDNLIQDYTKHYSNTVNISYDTEDSVGEEYTPPLPIKYLNPRPICTCPDMGEENLVRITEVAYKILRGETKLQ